MTVQFEPFDLYHLCVMQVQDRHAWLVNQVYDRWTEIEPRLVGPYSWTAWSAYGLPVACCGIMECGGTWAFLAKNLKRDMVAVSKYVRGVLDQFLAEKTTPYAEIDESHAEAVRWVRLLGFQQGSPTHSGLTTWHYLGKANGPHLL